MGHFILKTNLKKKLDLINKIQGAEGETITIIITIIIITPTISVSNKKRNRKSMRWMSS